MTTLSVQSDRNELDHEAIDREFSERSTLYKSMALGMSFSGQNIHFAEVAKHDDRFEVTKFGSIQTNMKFGTGIEGVEKNIQDLYSYLNGCLEDNDIHAKRLNLSLNTHLATLHKMMTDPDSTHDEFESHAKWEFSQQVLDELDQYIVNTSLLKTSGFSKLEPVLIVGVRRRFVDTLSKILEKCKIDLACMDVDILCAHAAYEMNYRPLVNQLTALTEARHGVVTVLLCRDYDVEYVYQFTASAKSTPAKLGDLMNHHLQHMLDLYSQASGNTTALGRVVLTNELAGSVLPYIETGFRPVVINPFQEIQLPEMLRPKEEKKTEGTEKSKQEAAPVSPDYSPFAESIGAAVKLLVE